MIRLFAAGMPRNQVYIYPARISSLLSCCYNDVRIMLITDGGVCFLLYMALCPVPHLMPFHVASCGMMVALHVLCCLCSALLDVQASGCNS
jgi:hypothetical protein